MKWPLLSSCHAQNYLADFFFKRHEKRICLKCFGHLPVQSICILRMLFLELDLILMPHINMPIVLVFLPFEHWAISAPQSFLMLRPVIRTSSKALLQCHLLPKSTNNPAYSYSFSCQLTECCLHWEAGYGDLSSFLTADSWSPIKLNYFSITSRTSSFVVISSTYIPTHYRDLRPASPYFGFLS